MKLEAGFYQLWEKIFHLCSLWIALLSKWETSDWFKAGMNSLISLHSVEEMFFGSSQNSLGGVVGVTI